MYDKEKMRATYDRIAVDFEKDVVNEPRRLPRLEAFAKHLPPRSRVLDLGCGPGFHAEYLEALGHRVLGIDLSPEMVRLAKARVPSAVFEVRDMREIGTLPVLFHGIHAYACLLHLPKREVPDVLRACHQLLLSGGILDVFVKSVVPTRAEEMVVQEEDYGYPYERFFSYYAEAEMHGLLEEAGFQILSSDVDANGRTPWIAVITQKREL